MKKYTIIILLLLLFSFAAIYRTSIFSWLNVSLYGINHTDDFSKLQDGDIIFQVSQSAQSRAIQLATKSKYSHCGIIYKKGAEYYVFEAIQPVTLTPLQKWINRGKDKHYIVKRLKNAKEVLTQNVLKTMKQEGEKLKGKNYDLTFEWSDAKIYCSELVWKLYKRAANIDLSTLEQLGDFDLSHPTVQAKIKERYGNKIPLKEKVVSPKALFESPLLITIQER